MKILTDNLPVLKIFLTGFLVAGCTAGSREVIVGETPISLPAVHTRYLSFPVPSSGIEAEFNPPVLRWPANRKSGTTYDVRLSQDSLFANDENFLATHTPWAMFNPHRRLKAGNWYWQYRDSGAGWSALQRFMVTDNTTALVSPPPEKFLSGLPKDHPRVLAEKAEIKKLQRLAGDRDALAIIREANEALRSRMMREADGLPTRHEKDKERNRKLEQDASHGLGDYVLRTVIPLCQAWLLSGNGQDAYRERALSIVFEVAKWDPEGVSGSRFSDFTDGRCMLAMAVAYDTFYDQLSEEERSGLKRAIHARAAAFYQSWVNNQEARLLSGHVWQHLLHYFFQTAMALYGDDPDAKDWLSYSCELFLARTPVLGGTDGGWAEGVSYFKMNMETVLDIPLFIKKYTGFDFINSHPWYSRHIDWLIYNIPPGAVADGFGDNTEEVLSPGVQYIAFAREIAKLTGSRLASWYAGQCERYEQPDLARNSTLRWVRLTKTRDLQMPAPAVEPELSTAKIFGQIGLVSMHSHPGKTDEDLMVSMRSSPFGCYGHFLSDQNCFNISYGGKKIFFRTGYKVTMTDPHRTGWYQHTKSNNGILINGAGQPYSTEAFGWMPRFLQGREIAYALGDASNAYSSRETNEDYGVVKFRRHLILLKPDVVVIYDEVESEKDAGWTWLIHSMKKIEIDTSANTFQSVFDQAKGVGRFWSSVPVAWALSDTFDVQAVNWRGSKNAGGQLKTYQDEQWHLKALTRPATRATRFLAILQISPHQVPADLSVETQKSVNVKVGKWKIKANVDLQLPPGLIITDQSGNTAFTTHGDTVEAGGKIYEGKGPARLVEIVNGKVSVSESKDQMPHDMKQRWLYYNETGK